MPILDHFRVGAPVFLAAWQHMAMVPHRRCVVGVGTNWMGTTEMPTDAIIRSFSLPTWNRVYAPELAVPPGFTNNLQRRHDQHDMNSTTSITHNARRHQPVLRLMRRCIAAWMAVRTMKR